MFKMIKLWWSLFSSRPKFKLIRLQFESRSSTIIQINSKIGVLQKESTDVTISEFLDHGFWLEKPTFEAYQEWENREGCNYWQIRQKCCLQCEFYFQRQWCENHQLCTFRTIFITCENEIWQRDVHVLPTMWG